MANIFKWLAAYTPTKERDPVEDRLTASLGYLLSASRTFKEEFLKAVLAGEITKRKFSRRILNRAKVEIHPEYYLDLRHDNSKLRGIPDLLIHTEDEKGGFVLFVEDKWDADIGFEEEGNVSQILKYLIILQEETGNAAVKKLLLLCRENPYEETPNLDSQEQSKKTTRRESLSEILRSERDANPALFEMLEIKTWNDLFDKVIKKKKDDDFVRPFYEFAREVLTMGTYDGIRPFGEDNPFTVKKAGDKLKQIVGEPTVKKWLEENGFQAGARKRRSPKNVKGEWLPLVKKETHFTEQPHITLGLNENDFSISVIVPDKDAATAKRIAALIKDDEAKFYGFLRAIRENLGGGLEYWLQILHRHAWRGNRTYSLVNDGIIKYKIDTLTISNGAEGKSFEKNNFKKSPLYNDLLQRAIKKPGHANIEIQFVAYFYLDPESYQTRNRAQFYGNITEESPTVKEIIKALKIQLSLLELLSGERCLSR
jgi:hypothetical protein